MQADVTASLLDRLLGTDLDRPLRHAVVESVPHTAQQPALSGPTRMTRRQHARAIDSLRRQIERDLVMLLQTRHLESDTDLAAWPHVQGSVLNYGVPDLAGTTGSGLDLRRLQRELAAAIKRFEPRLNPQTLAVRCRLLGNPHSEVLVQIESSFGPAETHQPFMMNVAICLGSGRCRTPAI